MRLDDTEVHHAQQLALLAHLWHMNQMAQAARPDQVASGGDLTQRRRAQPSEAPA